MFQDAPPPAPTPAPTVEQIVITGARLPTPASEAAFARVRLDAADLARNARLDEALRQVPAVSLFRRTTSLSANPTTQGISLRAIAPSGAGRTLVTLDGAPLNDPFGGWVIWSQVPPESLQAVDLVRGGGAGPWGAGALTGVVRLVERDRGVVVDLSAGEDGARRAVVSGGTAAGPLRVVVTAAAEDSDGYLAVRGPRAGAADTPLDYASRAAAVRLEAPGPMGSVLAARAGVYDEARGGGLEGAGSAVQGTLLSLAMARAPETRRPGFRALVWRHESDLTNRFVAVAADRSAASPAAEQFGSPATGWGATVAGRWRGNAWEAEAGIDARRYEGETRELFRNLGAGFSRGRVAGGESGVTGAYLDASWRRGPWLVVGGVRADRWTAEGGFRTERDLNGGAILLDLRPEDRSGEVVTGRAAVRREVGEGGALRLAAYSSFRPPSLNELHRPFRVGNDITEANAALEPERLEGVELGLEGEGPLRWSATVFATRLIDPITNVTIGQGPGTFPVAGFVPAGGVLRQRQNAGRIEAVGVELSAARDVGPVSLRGAVSATDAEVDGGTAAPQLTGLRPAQAPVWSATFGADWRAAGRLTLSLDGRYESRRFEDDLNSRILDGAATLDARVRYRLSDAADLWAAVDNLLDAEVETGETGDGIESLAPPRTLRVGLTLTY
jgi:outer membrane receptor protein involved in Fe transport